MAASAQARAWVSKVLGVSLDGKARPVEGGDAKGGDAKDGMAAWTAARGAAIGQLKALEGAIAKMKHPSGNAAIILVKAIQMNLTAKPDSRRSVGELRRYLEGDSIIAEAEGPNGFGIKVELRKPLLGALDVLEGQLAA